MPWPSLGLLVIAFVVWATGLSIPVIDVSQTLAYAATSEINATRQVGQSFTAGYSGQLVQVDFNLSLYNASELTFRLYSSEGLGSTPIYTQVIGAESLLSTSSFQNISLVPSIAVSQGNKYLVSLVSDGTMVVAFTHENPYSGGEAFYEGLKVPYTDLAFQTWVIPDFTLLSVVPSSRVQLQNPAQLAFELQLTMAMGEGDNLTIVANPASTILPAQANVLVTATSGLGSCTIASATTNSSSALTIQLGSGCTADPYTTVTLTVASALAPNPVKNTTLLYTVVSTSEPTALVDQSGYTTVGSAFTLLSVTPSTRTQYQTPISLSVTIQVTSTLSSGDVITIAAQPTSIFLANQTDVMVVPIAGLGACTIASDYTNSAGTLRILLGGGCLGTADNSIVLSISSALGPNPVANTAVTFSVNTTKETSTATLMAYSTRPGYEICTDRRGWIDANGYTCDNYTSMGWCADYWYGPNWDPMWGTFFDFSIGGVTGQTDTSSGIWPLGADTACCNCGYARLQQQQTNCVVGDWGNWSACSFDGVSTCTMTRRRTVITMPRNGAPCNDLIQTQTCTDCTLCILSEWSPWTCHLHGYKIRTRTIASAYYPGVGCPPLAEVSQTNNCSSADAVPSGYILQTFGFDDNGQLGLGNTVSQDIIEQVVPNPDELPITNISFGRYHSALLAGYLLYLCGRNAEGQLGFGDDIDRLSFQLLPVPSGQRVAQIALGGFHTAILDVQGVLFTFGSNTYGQLGLGTYSNKYVPTLVNATTIRFVALGDSHSAFITLDDSLYTFGSGLYGQLGYYALTQATPTKVTFGSFSKVSSVSLGSYHSAFIDQHGNVYCVGLNNYGQLGLSPSTASTISQPYLLVSGVSIKQISLGEYHAVVLLTSGFVYVTGSNAYGQLGLGSNVSATLAERVPVQHIDSVGAGFYHTGLVTTSGDLLMFGSNAEGQDGLGSVVTQYDPIKVSSYGPGGPVYAIAVGGKHTGVLRKKTSTPTLTPTVSTSGTKTSTESSTMSATISLTSSWITTKTPTATTDITPTAPIVSCGDTNLSLVDGPWTLSSTGRCFQSLLIGDPSTAWVNRHAQLRIITLPAPLAVSLVSATSSTSKLNLTLTSLDQGKEIALPIEVKMPVLEVLYGASPTNKLRSGVVAPNVQFELVYSGSVLCLVLFSLITVAVALAITLLVCLAYWLHWTHHHSGDHWVLNPRLSQWNGQITFIVGLSCTLTGIGWLVLVLITSGPNMQPLGLVIAGAILIALGAIALLGFIVWALRDPVQYICPGCQKTVSIWRFSGVYLPDPIDPTLICKAHKAHVLCLKCGKPVVTSKWAEAPRTRPYHMHCWASICEMVLGDPDYLVQWFETQTPTGPSTVELVHLLATAVQHSAMSTIEQLLRVSPSLVNEPVAQHGGRSVVHLAAQLGNLPVLQCLLETPCFCLDAACSVDPGAICSLYAAGLSEGNDVYIALPFLSLNSHPIYIGHEYGKYLFYDDTVIHGESDGLPAGWYISSHLGSSKSATHVMLPVTGMQETLVDNTPKRKSEDPSLPGSHLHTKDHQTSASAGAGKSIGQSPFIATGNEQDPMQEPPPTPSHGAFYHGYSHEKHHSTGQFLWLPQGVSLLLDTIGSSSVETIQFVVNLYRQKDPGCLVWQRDVGHRLWHPYAPDAQLEIQEALAEGAKTVVLRCPEHNGALLDFEAMQHVAKKKVYGLRRMMRSIFQCGPICLTSNPEMIPHWSHTRVLFSPGYAVHAAQSKTILALLVEEGIVDLSLCAPPTKVKGSPLIHLNGKLEETFMEVLGEEIHLAMGLGNSSVQPLRIRNALRRFSFTKQTERGRGGDPVGIGNRLTDGLEAPDNDATQLAFYTPGYNSDRGTLPFCAALPENTVGLRFQLLPIVQMAIDALMKLNELQRQQWYALAAPHVIALYVYSYELSYEEENYDQIYTEMNRAMRLRLQQLIAFWRPLIWEIDMALQALPPLEGKAFRGINCQLDSAIYQAGATISWPAFSSASQDQTVAEEFAKGECGTLFFLHGVSARSISFISRFPEEAEVLFPPNSTFQITSTLYGTTDIGAFYGRVDNVAMSETHEETPQSAAVAPRIKLAGHFSYLLYIPMNAIEDALQQLSDLGIQLVDSQEPQWDESIMGELLMLSDSNDWMACML